MNELIERRKANRGQGGFTLIELLVVIAILAVLAGVAVFAVGNLTEGADENACKLEAETMNIAIQSAIAKSDGATIQNADGYLSDISVQPRTKGSNEPVVGKYWTIVDPATPQAAVVNGSGDNTDEDCDSGTSAP